MEKMQRALRKARAERLERTVCPEAASAPFDLDAALRAGRSETTSSNPSHWPRMIGAVGILAAALLIWVLYTYLQADQVNFTAFEIDTADSVGRVAYTNAGESVTDLETELSQLGARIDSLADTIANLDGRLDVLAQSRRPHATPAPSVTASASPNDVPQTAPPAEQSPTPVNAHPPTPAAGARLAPAATDPGPWAINLASIADKTAADRFLADIRSQGIRADQYPIRVDGKQYWRTQVTGFATAEEAKAHATLLRNKLGIEDAWINRQ